MSGRMLRPCVEHKSGNDSLLKCVLQYGLKKLCAFGICLYSTAINVIDRKVTVISKSYNCDEKSSRGSDATRCHQT